MSFRKIRSHRFNPVTISWDRLISGKKGELWFSSNKEKVRFLRWLLHCIEEEGIGIEGGYALAQVMGLFVCVSSPPPP